jgi:hypothetical protein
MAGLGHNQPPLTLTEQLTLDHKKLMDDVEQLTKDDAALKALVEAAERPNEVGEVVGLTDELVEKMVEIGKKATKLSGSNGIDKDRTTATQSRRDEVEVINGFFNSMKTRAERVKNSIALKVGAYNDEKQAREKREAAHRAKIAADLAAEKFEEAQSADHSVLGDVVMNEATLLEDAAQKAANFAVKAGTGPMRTASGTVSSTGRWTAEVQDASKIPLEELRNFITLADLEKFCRAYAKHHQDKRPLAGVRIFKDTKTNFR